MRLARQMTTTTSAVTVVVIVKSLGVRVTMEMAFQPGLWRIILDGGGEFMNERKTTAIKTQADC
jgi:hypothetical protein